MGLALQQRIPIEAQTRRLLGQSDSDIAGEKIECRMQGDWGKSARWILDSDIILVGEIKTKRPKSKIAKKKSSKKLYGHVSHFFKGSSGITLIPLSNEWETLGSRRLAKLFASIRHEDLRQSPDASSLKNEFNELASQWYSDTRNISSAEQIVLHPAYQKIIGMGKDALPFIFSELKKTRGHWLWALAMILREDKAKPGMKFREAVDAWLAWGEKNSYV